jgi:hypothetical protein
MTLDLVFDNSGGDYHLIITDGCKGKLNPEDDRLSRLQSGTANREGLQRYLLYSNLVVVENFFLKPDGQFDIFCPDCETTYTVTKQQYEECFERTKKLKLGNT